MSSFALQSSGVSASRSIFRRALSLRRLLLGAWLVFSVTFGMRALVADQLYLRAWSESSSEKLELAIRIFPYERAIGTSLGYYYLLMNKPSLTALHEVRMALQYDPGAADLIKADMVYSFNLGKKEDAQLAFNRLKRITPNTTIVKELERGGQDH